MEELSRYLLLIVSLIIVGEAMALYIGSGGFRKTTKPWLSDKNKLLLFIDIGTGLWLLMVFFREPLFFTMRGDMLPYLIATGSHLWRLLETGIGYKNPFCANYLLIYLNWSKTAVLLAVPVVHLII